MMVVYIIYKGMKTQGLEIKVSIYFFDIIFVEEIFKTAKTLLEE